MLMNIHDPLDYIMPYSNCCAISNDSLSCIMPYDSFDCNMHYVDCITLRRSCSWIFMTYWIASCPMLITSSFKISPSSDDSLAQWEGPTTFACKSQECRLAGLVYLNWLFMAKIKGYRKPVIIETSPWKNLSQLAFRLDFFQILETSKLPRECFVYSFNKIQCSIMLMSVPDWRCMDRQCVRRWDRWWRYCDAGDY